MCLIKSSTNFNFWFSDAFSGNQKGTFGRNGCTILALYLLSVPHENARKPLIS